MTSIVDITKVSSTETKFQKTLHMIEQTEININLVKFTPSECIIDFNNSINQYQHGKAFLDGEDDGTLRTRLIVSDAKHIYEYMLNTEKDLGNGVKMYTRKTHQGCFDVDEDGHPLNGDGRNRIHLSCDVNTKDKTMIMMNYQIQCLLWNLEDRIRMNEIIVNGMGSKLCVNHKNNDCRNCYAWNLEITTKALNSLHSEFVRCVWAGAGDVNPLAKYRGSYFRLPYSVDGQTKQTLNFCLSVYDLIGYSENKVINVDIMEKAYQRSPKIGTMKGEVTV